MVLSLAGLVIAYFFSAQQENLLLAVPQISGTAFPIQTAQDSSIPLTFENLHFESVFAINSSQNVVLIGTNHNFPFVMNFNISHGRFFREDAVRYNHRVAVLNERAAFELFGTTEATGNEMTIRGAPYIVIGVINDGINDRVNVYVPATLLGNTTETIAANLNLSPAINDITILNEWRHMGITRSQYDFVNFYTLRVVIRDRVVLAFAVFAATFLLVGLVKIFNAIGGQISALRHLAREVYFGELFKKSPVWKLIGLGLAFLGVLGAFILLVMDSLMRILLATDARGMLANVQSASFATQISEIALWYNMSNLFSLSFLVFYLLLILIPKRENFICARGDSK